ncbi:hypothetical protein GOB94_13295 [Granulicella sp. 5B5]|uniref:hypothetical protein n=1 Tax=Granulicella sp. 5B5 TaxID=1617967 RepID=UPI0015F626FC|nr:hypothetical protein [Granulicella sp. 5B5]QMV19550.1 hypothetical protein GOB94_13295 [Granulicella sp. 5B5]
MQWPVLRRAFPWRTGLLLCSIPALALVALLAWFRWELPPLERYYLMAYRDSSKHAENPASTTQIEWLYKAASGRKSEPAIHQDVDSNGDGFLPIGLSSSARKGGWTQLVEMPVQRWKSVELASFLQEDFYDNRTFGEVIAEPVSFICVIPLLALYVVVMTRQELAAEWSRLYEAVYGDEFNFDWHAIWSQFKKQIRGWKHGLFAGAKASLSRRQLEPKEQPVAAAKQRSFHAEGDTPLRGEKPVVAAAAPVRPKRHTIFPGAAAIRNGDVPPKPWDESQWID